MLNNLKIIIYIMYSIEIRKPGSKSWKRNKNNTFLQNITNIKIIISLQQEDWNVHNYKIQIVHKTIYLFCM